MQQRTSQSCYCLNRSRLFKKKVSLIVPPGRYQKVLTVFQSIVDDDLHPLINIFTDLNTQSPSSRLAILSLDYGSELNLISRTLVNEVLGINIHPLDNASGSVTESRQTMVDGRQVRLQGYIDVNWSINSAHVPRKIHSTRFFVPEVDKPSFDAALAQESAQEYGLLKSSSVRRR